MTTQKEIVIHCTCGAIIPHENISFQNGTNEIGEEYSTVNAECSSCKEEFETFQWGWMDEDSEAWELMDDYINDK